MSNTTSSISPSQRASSPDVVGPALALLAWFGILLRLWLAVRNGKTLVDGLLTYFGFFTILTNILVALTLTLPVYAPATRLGRFFGNAQTKACAATSIALVGVGYHFLLSHMWQPQGLQWLADVLIHYVVPVLFCAYWLFVLPKQSLPWWSPLAWSAYPIAYFAYALVRGATLGVYPYYFIDVAAIGYGRALLNASGLLLGFVLVGWLFLGVVTMIERYRTQLSQ
jgi:hypothetical protein